MSNVTYSSSVQFRSVDDVVDAYVANNVPSFAIWHRKQLQFPFETESMEEGEVFLRDLLERLLKNRSAAVYMLCVYKNIGEGITNKTPFSASFNFQLTDPVSNNVSAVAMPSNNTVLESKVEALSLAVKQLVDRDDDVVEEVDNSVLGTVERLLDNPAIERLVTMVVTGLSGFKAPAVMSPGLGAVPVSTPGEESAKVLSLFLSLKAIDPDFVAHLDKLNQIAKENPGSFKMFLKHLESL